MSNEAARTALVADLRTWRQEHLSHDDGTLYKPLALYLERLEAILERPWASELELAAIRELVTKFHRTLSDRILPLEANAGTDSKTLLDIRSRLTALEAAASDRATVDDFETLKAAVSKLEGRATPWREMTGLAMQLEALQGRVDAHAEELSTNKQYTKRALRRTRQLRAWIEEDTPPSSNGHQEEPDAEWLAFLVERVDMVREIAQRCLKAQGCPPEHSMVARRILIWTGDPEERVRSLIRTERAPEALEELELAADTLATAADVFEELELAHYSDPEANALNGAAWAMAHRAGQLLSELTGNDTGAGVGPSRMELVD